MTVEAPHVTIVGGGLAGCEAALQLSTRGIRVTLHEMRPTTSTPAHRTGLLGELVCSNSFKSDDASAAAGTLKRELEALGSVVLGIARSTTVPAGGALAVDRDQFARSLTNLVERAPGIRLERNVVESIPEGWVIIATGPLTHPAFEPALTALVGRERLAFYDAAAPIVDALSLDEEAVFRASRYGKGGGADYLNAPLTREEYVRFHDELVNAERVITKSFETTDLFCACQPVEEVARTGVDALRFGAMKPVGLTDPRTGERPWAVLQLRAETTDRTAYNLVGFQTNLTWSEQRRVFSLIPGLGRAEFLRFGVMHRNTFVNAPAVLDPTLAVKSRPQVRIAGQLSGTEGYLEAAASGLFAALGVYAEITRRPMPALPETTALGSLLAYATNAATTAYQPMHVNWGLVPPLHHRARGKRERYAAYAARANRDLVAWIESHRWLFEAVAASD